MAMCHTTPTCLSVLCSPAFRPPRARLPQAYTRSLSSESPRPYAWDRLQHLILGLPCSNLRLPWVCDACLCSALKDCLA